MKELKYIKLYEAFGSTKLAKTVSYLKGEERKKFLEKLKQICNAIDFPYSELKDDYFQYLPFKTALKKSFKADIDHIDPCNARSEDAFDPKAAATGERCKNGKILRMWGKKTREVICPICKGTGVKPKTVEGDIGIIKFWFDQSGKFISVTSCDGIVRDTSKQKDTFSRNLDDYDVVKDLSDKDFLLLNTGDMISVTSLSYGSKKPIVCYIWRFQHYVFFLQDVANGNNPSHVGDPNPDWRKVGAKYSYSASPNNLRNAKLLNPKQNIKDPNSKEISPYDLNAGISIRSNGVKSISINVREALKDADFAIVLDFLKLKTSDFGRMSKKTSIRKELKTGSRIDPNMSDDNIRKRNIEKYITEISKQLDISRDITNCKKLILRILGHRNALFMIANQNMSVINDLIILCDTYYDLMNATKDDVKKSKAKDLKSLVEQYFKRSSRVSNEMTNNLKAIEGSLADAKNAKGLELYKLSNRLSLAIEDMIKRSTIECIEDFEIVIQKLVSIRNIIRNAKYKLNRVDPYYFDYVRRNNVPETVRLMTKDYAFQIIGYEDGIKRVIKLIDRM